jgi:hypothetical protein
MRYVRPPNCPYCRNHPLMSRKGFYKRGHLEPLYGLVPITDDGEIMEGKRPTPLRVFECNFCGVVALFQDHEGDTESGAQATGLWDKAPASQTEQILREQQRLRQQAEATSAQREHIVSEQRRLQQQLKSSHNRTRTRVPS